MVYIHKMGSILKLWTFVAILGGGIGEAYRILVIVPIPSGSHAILGEACVKTLLDAGHEVVFVTAIPNRLPAHPKFVEIDVSSNAKYFPSNIINLTSFLENPAKQPSTVDFLDHATLYCVETVKHEAVQKILNDGLKFDVIIAEWMFSEIYAGLSALLDCPLIWLSSMEPHSLILSLVDEESSPAYTADFAVNHVAPFPFLQRVEQLGMWIFVKAYKAYHVYFKETEEFNNLFAPMMKKLGKSLPSYDELRYNASIVLGNSHVSLGQPTRLPPNYISIGGYHVDPQTKPLSEDLKTIMDNAPNGVIYFSMGSILKSKDFTQKLKMELLNMLGSLKQTVLWKFEEDFPNLPDNVHVLKWASQQSILDHPNCILFISHGGLLSLTESIHYGVPVIGVPVFADQFQNVMRAERKGFAKKVALSNNLANDLKDAIKEVLDNPQYKENVDLLSFVYHHRPVHPRKELVHWVDHVIKTRGAPLLKSSALSVYLYQKLYLDLAVLILVSIYIFKFIVKKFISMISMRTLRTDSSLRVKKVD